MNRLREDMANVTQIGLMIFYGFIQQKVFEICDEDDDEKKTKEIKIPPHLDDVIYDQIK